MTHVEYIEKFFDSLRIETAGHIGCVYDPVTCEFDVFIHGTYYAKLSIKETRLFVIGWNASKTHHNKQQ